MKTWAKLVLALLGIFELVDIFRVALQWPDYNAENVFVHFAFAIGILITVGFNLLFIQGYTFSSVASRMKLILSFISQLIIVVLVSNLTLLLWIGCKPCTDGEINSARYTNLGILIVLFLLFIGLLFWSRKLAMPNPSFKRDS